MAATTVPTKFQLNWLNDYPPHKRRTKKHSFLYYKEDRDGGVAGDDLITSRQEILLHDIMSIMIMMVSHKQY